jgi:hypothetical protein
MTSPPTDSCRLPRKPQISTIPQIAIARIRASITPIATCDRQIISLLLLVPADKSHLALTDGTVPPEIDRQCTLHWRGKLEEFDGSTQPPGKTSAEGLPPMANLQDSAVAVFPDCGDMGQSERSMPVFDDQE